MTRQSALLVFPIDVPQSAAFARTAHQLGFKVVAASSEPMAADRYPDYLPAYLPYVTEHGFGAALAELLRTHGIDAVFAPHPAIWWHLRTLCQSAEFPVAFHVCNESPYEMDWQSYGEAYRWAEDCVNADFLTTGTATPGLPLSNLAGLYRGYNQIPGQSDNTKLRALTQIARQTAPGDIVEIGSLYGKSAFALAWLAKFHRIGSVVCVDPWELSAIRHQGEQASLINAAAPSRDWQQAFLGFAASLSVFDNVTYLRDTSGQAVERYRQAADAGNIRSDEFGSTPITGRISLLHIDGNHKYESVRQDVEAWRPLVQPGGWILLDDYVWAFGDGPRRAGDELLATGGAKTAFTAADTLFVQV
ncbi:MAG: class I SAM-dependent methyltransferase [Gammaproteobacteria bacterium]|nr:class I SAM-dependent methyltransferase [Gammaproteobacteria bacterium]MBU1416529.1 class I SAM-dependent methyltransferase [Gammaproteobacteria bacterium]